MTFKFKKGQVVIANGLPEHLIDLGFKNKGKYKITLGALAAYESPFYYVSVGSRFLRLQSGDGIISGNADFFEVVNE